VRRLVHTERCAGSTACSTTVARSSRTESRSTASLSHVNPSMTTQISGSRPRREHRGPSAAKWPVGPAPTMTARMPVPLFPPLPRRRNRRATATPASGQASAQPHRGESLTPDAAALHGGAAQRLGLGRDDLTGRVWPDHPSCTRSTAGHCETGCLPNVTGDHDPDRGGVHRISIWSPQHLHGLCMILDLAWHEGCHVVRATCRTGQPGGGRGCPICSLSLKR
jgi:hypothetical protein